MKLIAVSLFALTAIFPFTTHASSESYLAQLTSTATNFTEQITASVKSVWNFLTDKKTESKIVTETQVEGTKAVTTLLAYEDSIDNNFPETESIIESPSNTVEAQNFYTYIGIDETQFENRLQTLKQEILAFIPTNRNERYNDTTIVKQIDSVYRNLSTSISEIDVSESSGGGINNGDSVSFAELTVDSSLFVTDSVNNRIGIGTSTPTDTLSVDGALYLSAISSPSVTTDRLYNVSGDLYWNGTQLNGGGGSGTVNSGTTGYIPYYASDGTTLTATSSLTISANGDLTTSARTLTFSGYEALITSSSVFGASQDLAISTYHGGVGSSGELQMYTGNSPSGWSGGINLYTGNGELSGGVAFQTGDAYSPSGSSGDVDLKTGIGTTTGDINILTGNGINSGDINITAGTGSLTNGDIIVKGGGSNGKVLLNATGGNVGIGTTSPFAKLSVNGDMVNVGHSGFGNKARVNASYIWPSDPISTSVSILEEVNNLSSSYVRGINTELLLKPSTAPTGGKNVAAGSFFAVTDSSIGYDFPDTISGLLSEVGHSGSGYASYLIANEAVSFNNNAGSVGSADGVWAQVTNAGAGTIDYMTGVDVFLSNTGTGAVTDAYGVYVYPTLNSGAGTIENNYGIFIANQSGIGSVDSYNIYSSGSSSLNYFGGKVGIGTTSPYAKLSVAGTIVGQNFVGTSTAASTFGGNVGIGTTSPYAKLSVAGTVVGQNFMATSTTATSTFAGGVQAGGSTGLYVLSNGKVGVNVANPIANFDVDGSVRFGSTETSMFVTPGTGISIRSKLNIASLNPGTNGQIIALGLPSSAGVTARGVSIFDARTVAHEPSLSVFSLDEQNGIGFSWEGGSATAYLKTTGGNIGIRSGTTDIATYLSTGNVGIGTSSPYAKLSVAGTIVGANFIGTTTATSTFAGAVSIGDPNISLAYIKDGRAGFGAAYINYNLSTYALDVGNVARIFQSSGDGNILTLDSTEGTPYAGLLLNHNGGTALIYGYQDNSLHFDPGTGGDSIFESGNVGIGTSTPGAQLTTTGTVQFANFGAGTLQTDSQGNLSVSSDERLKDKTGDFIRGLEAINGITPISYKWNENSGLETEGTYTGFSAQNVREFIPEAVGEDKRGYLTLSDRGILAAAVNAIKEIGSVFEKIEDGVAYMKNVVVNKITAKEVHTETLCLDGLCINKEQLEDLLQNAGTSGSSPVEEKPVVEENPDETEDTLPPVDVTDAGTESTDDDVADPTGNVVPGDEVTDVQPPTPQEPVVEETPDEIGTPSEEEPVAPKTPDMQEPETETDISAETAS